MNILAFKIWYAKYAITGDSFEEWERARDNGVQAVAIYYDEFNEEGERIKKVFSGQDKYGLTRTLEVSDQSDFKKTGTNISNKRFKEILKDADDDFGDDWIMANTVIKQAPDPGGKMIDIPDGDRNKTLSKLRGSK